jgi:phosphatidylserine/phosphatidylglycerophosphate/cardiolipin synthase-like enzyme
MFSGCVKSPQTRLLIDDSVAAQIDREITCTEAPESTCAISSEFQDLADQAFSQSTDEAPQHFVSLLNYGQDALLARLHLIRAARKSIELQTYIWANDEVGRLMFFELLEAARRGVKVRIIADQMGSAEDPGLIARLATAHINLEVGFYNPIFSHVKTSPLRLFTGALFSLKRIDQRMHNKVLIVDGRMGFVGGRNIENKYYDYDPGYSFKDRDVLIIGPAADQMRASFEKYWNDEIVVKAIYLVDVGQEIIKAGSDVPSLLDKPDLTFISDIESLANQRSIYDQRPVIKPFPVGRITFVADLPGKRKKHEDETYMKSMDDLRKIVAGAKESLTVQTPYLVLSNTARKLLKKMRKHNPGLKITVSTNSLAATDVPMIYGITFKQKRGIIRNLKPALYEFKPYPGDIKNFIRRYDQLTADHVSSRDNGSSRNSDSVPTIGKGLRIGLHAKSIVIDGTIVIIGSHNLDPRSRNINTESVAIIWDEHLAGAVEKNILTDTEPQNSWVIARRQQVPFISRFGNIIGGISSALPFLDIWPFRYSSSYKLKEGMEPLSTDHPDFYKHYENVGQFPEVHLSLQAIQTRLIKTFGGFTAPLM